MAPVMFLFVGVTAAAVVAQQEVMRRQAPSGVPSFAVDNAPYVYIHSQDQYQPSDIGAQVQNTHPDLNSTAVPSGSLPNPLTLSNLDQLDSIPNSKNGSYIYLASNDDFSQDPAYLNGVRPDANGKTDGAVSCAIIVNDKQNGTVDVYYMYFYAYNRGDIVLGNELGDHIGDWEHNMIRFTNGEPSQMWFSEHDNGEAFQWSAVNKTGNRPLVFSGNGTHANWATTGTHDHTIPNLPLPDGPLEDYTDDAGPRWDPTASAYFYSVTFPAGTAPGDDSNPTFTAYNGQDPTAWLYYEGQWGDDQLPSSDPRQKEFFGFYKYTAGPTGPRDKQLNRVQVCPDNGDACVVRDVVTPGT